MPDLLINKPKTLKQQEQSYQNSFINNANTGIQNQNQSNTLLDNIQNSEMNRKLFSSFIIQKNNQYQENNSPEKDRYSFSIYKNNLKNKNKKELAFTVAGAVTLLLSVLTLVHDRKSFIKLREYLSQKMESLQSLKDSKQLKALGKVKLAVTKFSVNALNYLFSFDKIKDFAFLRTFESLGKFGKIIINASKFSLSLTEKYSLTKRYKSLKNVINSVAKSTERISANSKSLSNDQEKHLIEKLNVLLNGNEEGKNKGLVHFAEDLITGIKERTGILKNTIQENNIDKYREKYYPKSFKWDEFKTACKNWKKFLFSPSENKDVLRENWDKTAKILMENIDKTGQNPGKIKNVGEARKELIDLVKEMEELCNKPDCSIEFKNLAEKVKDLNNRINNSECAANPINFETSGEKYAGRVLDLFAGGGMTEILIPPVAAGLITYQTLKDSKPEERKEKFIRSGGPALIGGLTGWMITSNLLAISGAKGMLIGLLTGGFFDFLSKRYLKHMKKTQNTNQENINISNDKNETN